MASCRSRTVAVAKVMSGPVTAAVVKRLRCAGWPLVLLLPVCTHVHLTGKERVADGEVEEVVDVVVEVGRGVAMVPDRNLGLFCVDD